MARPDCLPKFLEQTVAMKDILLLKSKLAYDQRNKLIGNKLRSTDRDCLRAENSNLSGKKRWLHRAILTLKYKGINIEDYLQEIEVLPDDSESPTCSDDFPFRLDLSYDHLLGVAQRFSLKGTPEMQIFSLYRLKNESLDTWGYRIHEGLKQNSSSWVLLNLAAFYWRMIGNAGNEIECLRRSLFYTPVKYYDVPLAALGTVLHKHGYIQDASMLFEKAIHFAHNTSLLHFMLANAKAANEEYQEATIHYTNAIKLQPEFEAAKKLLSAAKCEMNIIKLLYAMSSNSTNPFKQMNTREALKEIRSREANVIQNTMHDSIQDVNQKRFNGYKKYIKYGRKCMANGEELFICNPKLTTTVPNFNRFIFEDEQEDDLYSINFEPQLKLLDMTCQELATLDINRIINQQTPLPLLPIRKQITSRLYYRNIDHVPADQRPLCHTVTKLDHSMRTFEHLDGINNRKLLRKHNKKQLIMKWFHDVVYAPAVVDDASIERWLTYIMTMEETSWLVYDIAAMYWIAEGNHTNAIECFRLSLHFASNEYATGPLIGLAYTLLLNGYIENAITVAKAALSAEIHTQSLQYIGRSVLGLSLLAAHQLSPAIEQFKEAISNATVKTYLEGLIKYITCKLEISPIINSDKDIEKCRATQENDAKENIISTIQETDRQLKIQTQLLQELKQGEKKLQELIKKSKE
ncbi:uncharacterized protein TRIADDRAFT_51483 [Trichoplax adhaerens]|uniref:Uncharacterized protein n=1 Tax=Trichoplax adhaerens TaxID=10228 RepID=B3RJB9_TRIAD|nr:hypothetical protein TRIADDRAFT_51483 [Trichoplax adhaerens]EDV28506.1 hypothetical protein TRIADDRAFT_51483 [Trichoplax adhaerens]|eukprot:XP_002107708.1 hypothetical protein TRIADDRAFT_51483 [Trichoplax adhaerens]